eukprot:2922846-Pleurochrysis_carterae.AAC.2
MVESSAPALSDRHVALFVSYIDNNTLWQQRLIGVRMLDVGCADTYNLVNSIDGAGAAAASGSAGGGSSGHVIPALPSIVQLCIGLLRFGYCGSSCVGLTALRQI